ncbi:hypothetical protein ACFWUZ_28765 [Streptomyces sp. NPDC058646]|uniref:hypothetical protein n=1 Tax=Streptomyces sp. NPDC058646 TaxID=3346574 RepID=UPI003663EBA9
MPDDGFLQGIGAQDDAVVDIGAVYLGKCLAQLGAVALAGMQHPERGPLARAGWSRLSRWAGRVCAGSCWVSSNGRAAIRAIISSRSTSPAA